jgi:hypothetical protein
MKSITASNARKHIATILDTIRETGDVFVIERHNTPEVLLIKFPQIFNKKVDEITNINAYSESFSFLEDEPELYSHKDVKKRYV